MTKLSAIRQQSKNKPQYVKEVEEFSNKIAMCPMV